MRDLGEVYTKKRSTAVLQPFVNLKSNTMKNTLQKYDNNFVLQNFLGKKRRFVTLFNDFVLFFKNLGLWQRSFTVQKLTSQQAVSIRQVYHITDNKDVFVIRKINQGELREHKQSQLCCVNNSLRPTFGMPPVKK